MISFHQNQIKKVKTQIKKKSIKCLNIYCSNSFIANFVFSKIHKSFQCSFPRSLAQFPCSLLQSSWFLSLPFWQNCHVLSPFFSSFLHQVLPTGPGFWVRAVTLSNHCHAQTVGIWGPEKNTLKGRSLSIVLPTFFQSPHHLLGTFLGVFPPVQLRSFYWSYCSA